MTATQIAPDSTSSGRVRSPRGGRLRLILEMIRFSHTVFALPFALLATVLAVLTPLPDGATPGVRGRDLAGILLCMVLARSAAMAFNRLVDQRIDAANPRTRDRHLPAGLLGRGETLRFTAACCAGFVAACALFLPNWLPLAASVPVLLWLLGYSFAKRFTAAAHLWLGAALALAPLCAWVAIRGTVVLAHPADLLPPAVIAVGVALWVAGFDIVYACQDETFDRRSGLHSVPARFGTAGALRIAAALHAGTLVAFALLPQTGPALGLGGLYYLALAAIALLLCYEHTLVRPDDLGRVGVAFFHCNAIISVGLFAAASLDSWLG